MSSARKKVVSSNGRRGRPRDPETDAAILEAARRLLGEQGYSRLSLGAIAAAAGVGKPTLYRRFASKADLAMAALASGIDDEGAPPPGSTREELRFLLGNLRARLARRSHMILIGTLLAEEDETPELIALFRDRVWRRRRELLERALERGRRRGEVRPDADLDAAIHLLIGSLYARHLSSDSIPRDWVDRTIDVVLRGIAPS